MSDFVTHAAFGRESSAWRCRELGLRAVSALSPVHGGSCAFTKNVVVGSGVPMLDISGDTQAIGAQPTAP